MEDNLHKLIQDYGDYIEPGEGESQTDWDNPYGDYGRWEEVPIPSLQNYVVPQGPQRIPISRRGFVQLPPPPPPQDNPLLGTPIQAPNLAKRKEPSYDQEDQGDSTTKRRRVNVITGEEEGQFEDIPSPPPLPPPQIPPPPPPGDDLERERRELSLIRDLASQAFKPFSPAFDFTPKQWWDALNKILYGFNASTIQSQYAKRDLTIIKEMVRSIYDEVLRKYAFIINLAKPVVDIAKVRNGINRLILINTKPQLRTAKMLEDIGKDLYAGYGIGIPSSAVPAIVIQPQSQVPLPAARGRAIPITTPATTPPAARGRATPAKAPAGRGRGAGRGAGPPPENPPAPVQEGERRFELPDALNNINDPCYDALKKALFKGKVFFFFLKKTGLFP